MDLIDCVWAEPFRWLYILSRALGQPIPLDIHHLGVLGRSQLTIPDHLKCTLLNVKDLFWYHVTVSAMAIRPFVVPHDSRAQCLPSNREEPGVGQPESPLANNKPTEIFSTSFPKQNSPLSMCFLPPPFMKMQPPRVLRLRV